MFPQFLGIGAQKAGTTWLHAMLSQHRELWLPHFKELHYFDRKFPIDQEQHTTASTTNRKSIGQHLSARLQRFTFSKLRDRFSIRRWRDLAWECRYVFGRWDDEWYASLFRTAKSRIPGEITPAYACLNEKAVAHVHTLMPDARIIFLMRDPIDRAWSHARMDLADNGGKPKSKIDDAEFIAHFASSASRLRGDYLGTIRRWGAKYPENQFFLGFYDEILARPEDLLMRIHRFLGVSDSAQDLPTRVSDRVNAGAQAAIPHRHHQYLCQLYLEELQMLSNEFGTYPTQWLERCGAVLDRKPST